MLNQGGSLILAKNIKINSMSKILKNPLRIRGYWNNDFEWLVSHHDYEYLYSNEHLAFKIKQNGTHQ